MINVYVLYHFCIHVEPIPYTPMRYLTLVQYIIDKHNKYLVRSPWISIHI
jgi:hypothetical protein